MSQERNLVMIRMADPKTEPVREWCERNSTRNAFDEKILDYPTTKVLAAHSNGTVYAYMPVQGTAMIESIGLNVDVRPLEQATAVMELTKGAALLASNASCKELYFLASDEITAEGAKRMGFSELPYRVFRMRLT